MTSGKKRSSNQSKVYAATLTDSDFQLTDWPQQGDEEKQVYVQRLTTWIRGLAPVQLLIVKRKVEASVEQMRFFITSRLDNSLAQHYSYQANGIESNGS